jgi:FdhE protein
MEKHKEGIREFAFSFKELVRLHEGLFVNESFDRNILADNLRLIKENKYSITDDIWTLHEEKNRKFIFAFIELIKSFAPEYLKDADKLLSFFRLNVPSFKELFMNILSNKQKKIIDFSRQNDISEDFIIFFSIFSAIPFRKAVADLIQMETDLKSHVSGFCPVCGHWPVMSYLMGKEREKKMACICCGTYWSFRRLICPFCLNTNNHDLGYLNIDEEKKVSAYTCNKCRRYLKTKTVSDNHIITIEEIIMDFLNSGELDIAAVQNKYIHESIIGTRFQGPDDKHIDDYNQKLF